MRLLVLDENYPHLDNLMGDVFVHVRMKEYARFHEVKAISFFHQPQNLVYEGIELELHDNISSVLTAIKKFSPDRILIHFYQEWMLKAIIRKLGIPTIIWVHGYEALGWYRRLFNYSWYSPVLYRYIIKNSRQQFFFRKLIKYADHSRKVNFIFVSKWMCRTTEEDTISTIRKKEIIPNPIDTSLFSYKQKHPDLRKKILLLRSFATRKYANDISVKAIELLSTKPFFNDLEFTLMGTGPLFKRLTFNLKRFTNVHLEEHAVQQVMIPGLHAQHGVFLCPTRQDAQGVSMCEAMSSGLVPITSDNTAIPEFVSHKKTGYLTKNAEEVAFAIESLYYNPHIFESLSQQAAASIRNSCSLEAVTSKELKLIENNYD